MNAAAPDARPDRESGGSTDPGAGAGVTAHGGGSAGDVARPKELARLDAVSAAASAGAEADAGGRGTTGAVWRLSEAGRQLDANLVRLEAGATVAAHAEPELDVLFLAVAGCGTLTAADGSTIALTPHALVWLPRGSRRALTAGPEGLAYLTVHRARPGMRIRLPDDPVLLRQLEEREAEAEFGAGSGGSAGRRR